MYLQARTLLQAAARAWACPTQICHLQMSRQPGSHSTFTVDWPGPYVSGTLALLPGRLRRLPDQGKQERSCDQHGPRGEGTRTGRALGRVTVA